MPCYFPMDGFSTLKDGFVMTKNHPQITGLMRVPCGQCIGCRLERSRQWAVRSMNEASTHENNIFGTFTYDDENLPLNSSLLRSDFQKFIKRLRKKVPPLRLFYCGEYGDETKRPHYHAILFGYEPNDPILHRTVDGIETFTSEKLTSIWTHGHVEFSSVTFDSCAYVARYCTKKLTGQLAEETYNSFDPETGEIIELLPPFNGMSLQPGIGIPWLEKWKYDVYEKYEIIMRGQAMRPPRGYDDYIKKHYPGIWELSRPARTKRAEKAIAKSLDPKIRHSRRAYAANKIQTQKLEQRKKI